MMCVILQMTMLFLPLILFLIKTIVKLKNNTRRSLKWCLNNSLVANPKKIPTNVFRNINKFEDKQIILPTESVKHLGIKALNRVKMF